MQTKIQILSIVLLLVAANSFSIFAWHKKPVGLTQKCLQVLPYGTNNINHNTYGTWFGKVGQNINGTSYLAGHIFSRHIAINYKCTDEQKQQNKTVFYDEPQFYKALNRDTTQCTMTNQTAFNFNQNHVITNSSQFIRGIDCRTGAIGTFNSYFVEYKRAIQNAHPSQAQYMASRYATIWTFYPKRA